MSIREPAPFDGSKAHGSRSGVRRPPSSPARSTEMRSAEVRRRPERWSETHPDAFAVLKRSYAVIGHSAVLMVLSLSLIGTALTVGHLHLAVWLEPAVRLAASLGAVGCGGVALWRVTGALWRGLRAVLGTWRSSREQRGGSDLPSRTAGSGAGRRPVRQAERDVPS
jgi:hypothetical protein